MTETLDDVIPLKKKPEPAAEAAAAAELVRLAKEQGLSLTGPDGLLKQLTKAVLETALNEEMTQHLGYAKNDPAGAGSGNVCNGSRSKTVLTDATGHVQIDVPRDRAGSFEPQIVKKRQCSAVRSADLAAAADLAETVARSITDPDQQAQALAQIARAIASADPDRASRVLGKVLAAESWMAPLSVLGEFWPQVVLRCVDALSVNERSRYTERT
ncbi:hypothetical protein Acy02nite_88850 [Actinoplanes cyaneus]|uniref:Mutator family transposase n=1 Tax=Actinoplanes cyaneus TaxID=52696 RepID=A0A919ISL9_9ACTN|nr:Transposase, Mutator family [Actinoplanes cyaneus]GID71004.1 hypothetical protein Acy02nite_88850 [Actinoplanes cyaneus]